MKCPPGYVRRGDRCIRVIDTPNSKRKASAKQRKEALTDSETMKTESLTKTDPYAEFYKVGEGIYKLWQHRPDLPAWLSVTKGSPLAVGIEAAEAFIDIQFELAKDIHEGRVAGKDQYGSIERERVESIGTDFTWSPGGFQI